MLVLKLVWHMRKKKKAARKHKLHHSLRTSLGREMS